MNLTLPIAILVVLFTILCVVFLSILAVNRLKSQAFRLARAYFEPPDPKTPAEFARTIDLIAARFSAHLSASIKASFMGDASVDAKMQKRVDQALAKDEVGQTSPLLGMALEAWPSLGGLVTKNSKYMPLVLNALKARGQNAGANGGGQAQLAPAKFNL